MGRQMHGETLNQHLDLLIMQEHLLWLQLQKDLQKQQELNENNDHQYQVSEQKVPSNSVKLLSNQLPPDEISLKYQTEQHNQCQLNPIKNAPTQKSNEYNPLLNTPRPAGSLSKLHEGSCHTYFEPERLLQVTTGIKVSNENTFNTISIPDEKEEFNKTSELRFSPFTSPISEADKLPDEQTPWKRQYSEPDSGIASIILSNNNWNN